MDALKRKPSLRATLNSSGKLEIEHPQRVPFREDVALELPQEHSLRRLRIFSESFPLTRQTSSPSTTALADVMMDYSRAAPTDSDAFGEDH